MGDAVGAAENRRLRRAYGFVEPRQVRDYYDSWAAGYDAELIDNGYASPARVAAAMAALAPDLAAPVLDYGCGTGLSGTALLAVGFSIVDGADPSSEMLRVAAAKQIYRRLVHLDLDAALPPFDRGSYAVVAAVGLIGPGAAPLELFDQLLDLVMPGGLLGVSFNDVALADPAYPAKIHERVSDGTASVVFEERGPHLPGLGVEATVFVLSRSPGDRH